MNPIVEIRNVSRQFGSLTALKGINLQVHEGELFGLIGPDGAGKTTLFRILATLLVPDSGSATLFGLDSVRDYRKIRPLLGYMPGRFSLYQELSVEENVRFFASLFGTTLEENYSRIEPVYRQIEPFRKRLARDLSGGMKQKLALSCALIHRPRLLLLDEPTTGVDAVSRKEFWEMLLRLKEEGLPVIVSTPYMDEARRCDRIALIQEGDLLQEDTPDRIAASASGLLFGVRGRNRYRLIQLLRSHPHAASVHPFGEWIHFTDRRKDAGAGSLRDWLREKGVNDAEVRPLRPGIENRFMELMQEREDQYNE